MKKYQNTTKRSLQKYPQDAMLVKNNIVFVSVLFVTLSVFKHIIFPVNFLNKAVLWPKKLCRLENFHNLKS